MWLAEAPTLTLNHLVNVKVDFDGRERHLNLLFQCRLIILLILLLSNPDSSFFSRVELNPFSASRIGGTSPAQRRVQNEHADQFPRADQQHRQWSRIRR